MKNNKLLREAHLLIKIKTTLIFLSAMTFVVPDGILIRVATVKSKYI